MAKKPFAAYVLRIYPAIAWQKQNTG